MQNALKVFSKMAAGEAALLPAPGEEEDEDEEGAAQTAPAESPEPPKPEDVAQAAELLISRLPLFAQSSHIEVQERACFALELAKLHASSPAEVGPQLFVLFDEELLPVAKTAQKKVQVPEGLDLDTPIFPEEPEPEEVDETSGATDDGSFTATQADMDELRRMGDDKSGQHSHKPAPRKRRPDNPFILGGGDDEVGQVEAIPVEKITEDLGELKVSVFSLALCTLPRPLSHTCSFALCSISTRKLVFLCNRYGEVFRRARTRTRSGGYHRSITARA
jgi:hypothetical protein